MRNGLVRIARAWRVLAPEQRFAALAALGLLFAMLLPWYGKDTFDEKLHRFVEDSCARCELTSPLATSTG